MTVHGSTQRARGFRLVRNHGKAAMDYHEVIWVNAFQADKMGRVHESPRYDLAYEWHRFVCNNGDCRFHLLVRSDRLAAFVTQALTTEGVTP